MNFKEKVTCAVEKTKLTDEKIITVDKMGKTNTVDKCSAGRKYADDLVLTCDYNHVTSFF